MTRSPSLRRLKTQQVAVTLFATILLTPTPAIVLAHGGHGRSEERRVGKEC